MSAGPSVLEEVLAKAVLLPHPLQRRGRPLRREHVHLEALGHQLRRGACAHGVCQLRRPSGSAWRERTGGVRVRVGRRCPRQDGAREVADPS